MSHRIAIVGAGGIGRAVGLILAADPLFEIQLHIGDLYLESAQSAADWIEEGVGRAGIAFPFAMPEEGASEEMHQIFTDCEVILDCLPGSQAPRIAQLALEHKMHYANLTEYVAETEAITEMAKDAETGFVLQTGLAPGFINVLCNKLYQDFSRQYQVEKVDKMKMKVGALTRYAVAPHFYGFTWSPIGVATEYVKPAYAVRNGEKKTLPALSERETIILNGVVYEDNLTSGGAADLPEAFDGKVKDLDYKTLRYPGHYSWVHNTLNNTPVSEDPIEYLENHMLENVPMVEEDLVIIYSRVEGKDHRGQLRAIEKSYRIEPMLVGKHRLRAIQTTTAAPLAEVARMLLTNRWKGVIFQSQIDTQEFLNGPFVSAIYGKWANNHELVH